MTTSDATKKKPLWLLIEENILGLDSQSLSGENLEASIQRIAGELDNAGYNVSHLADQFTYALHCRIPQRR